MGAATFPQPASTLPDALQVLLEETRRRSLRAWGAAPEERSLWRPEGAVHCLAELVRHVGEADQFWMNVLDGDRYRGAGRTPEQLTSLAHEIEEAEACRVPVLERVRALPLGDFSRPVEVPQYNVRCRVIDVFTRLADHEAHHRGQFLLCLRLSGLPVPFIWD